MLTVNLLLYFSNDLTVPESLAKHSYTVMKQVVLFSWEDLSFKTETERIHAHARAKYSLEKQNRFCSGKKGVAVQSHW